MCLNKIIVRGARGGVDDDEESFWELRELDESFSSLYFKFFRLRARAMRANAICGQFWRCLKLIFTIHIKIS